MRYFALFFFLLVLSASTPAPETYIWSATVLNNESAPVPGAVVSVLTPPGTRSHAVTDNEGKFQLPVPGDHRHVNVVVSYAGFADESLVVDTDSVQAIQLVTPDPIELGRKYRMKVYLRTARRQVRRSLRSVYR